MDYYICSTEDGPRLVGTQADAKALDPEYQDHAVPTDKYGLMGYLNNIFAEKEPDDVPIEDERFGAPPEEAPIPAPAEDKISEWRERSYDMIEIEQIIHDTPDDQSYFLDNLEQCIQLRRNEIVAKSEQEPKKVDPPKRRRKLPE